MNNLSKHECMIQATGLLTEYFESFGIKPIIVGGLSVEIYTRGNYTTHDIDLVSDGREQFDDLLIDTLGFKKAGRSWYSEKLEISLEIPSNHLEGNMDKVIELKLPNDKKVFVIGIEDIIIHRLEWAVVEHNKNPEWSDDYEWARRMYEIHKND